MNAAPLAGDFDPGSELHDPALYRPAARASYVATLDAIGEKEIAFYRANGYLAVRQAFSPTEVDAALEGLSHLIMGGNPAFRGIVFEAAAREVLPQLSLEERQDAVRKIMSFVGYDDRLRRLADDIRLTAVIARLMGGRPPNLFQDMGLIKPPRLGREKPWHQDHAYFNFPLGTPIVGVWVALDEATVENGCMQVLAGRHREGPIVHFRRRDWQICDDQVLGTNSVAVPLPPGGLLFFDGDLLRDYMPSWTGWRRSWISGFYQIG